MIAILDYGVGNLFSLRSSLQQLGLQAVVVHYRAACRYGMEEHLAETVGVSYAIGLFLQFLENNLIHNAAVEAVILTVAFWTLLFLVGKK